MADVPVPPPEAWPLHDTLLELLKRLNQAHEESRDVDGLEYLEVQRAMAPFWSTRTHQIQLDAALQLLVGNGLVRTDSAPVYAWDRNRVVGERFLITTEGKDYLRKQLQVAGRIP